MELLKKWGFSIAGLCAGAVNGLLGAGGGMVLVPLLSILPDLNEREIFPSSVVIILPICIVSLCFALPNSGFDFFGAIPYLLGSLFGGLLSGKWGQKIPTQWLHKILGCFVLWGGIRYLC